MDKNSFIKILHHFSDSSAEEAQEILSLKQHYPYSQLLHALSARVSKDHDFNNHQHELQLAAVYASDRAVLKEVVTTTDKGFSTISTTPTAEVRDNASIKITRSIDTESLAEEVIHDLERLGKLKHNFETALADFNNHTPPATENKTLSKSEPPVEDPIEKIAHDLKETPGLTKKQRIIALAKAADALAEAEAKKEKATESESPKKKENPTDLLIDEIASTKEEIDPETEKQKEQIQIIDEFIKAQPSITSAREKSHLNTPQTDLSTIKPGEFGDNIVSETLVDILIKQGKKDKAIEVLKKLIWKFPQKKAYFAAQIEELKK